MYFSHAILLVHFAVLTGAVHIKKDEVAETINELDNIHGRQFREISQHRQLQDNDATYIRNDNAFRNNRQLTENLQRLEQEPNMEKKGLEEGYKFDKPTDLDPDSDLAFLLDGMSIDDHGNVHQPIGRHLKDKTRAIADNFDYHPAPPSDPSKREFGPNIQFWPNEIVPYEINSTCIIECGFEQGQTCAFQNTNGDDFNWTLEKSGSTSTTNTGPSAAHNGTQYAYIEVNGQGQGFVAILSSKNTDLFSSSYCLRFYYHMYGQDIGNLTVYSQTSNSSYWSKPWTRSGNQGNQWKQASVDITGNITSGIVIDIEASKGKAGNNGDIAIDDITLCTGSCTCSKVIECGFEQGQTCALENTNGDDFNWTLEKSGSTSTTNTGPSAAHSGNQYAYIEVDGQGEDFVALLSSSNTDLFSSSYCLRFYYHMYGHHIGNLTVYSQTRNSGYWSKRWTRSGNQENQWIKASVDITGNITSGIVIDIEASKGKAGNNGDIAIDDITLCTGSCTCSKVIECGFEQGQTCALENTNGDDFNWTLEKSGSTSTTNTGPSAAHSGNQYAYIEVDGQGEDFVALLSSSNTDLFSSSYCLRFYYHMYGHHIGNLTVYSQTRNSGYWSKRWTRSGNQENQWIKASVDITGNITSGIVFDIEATKGKAGNNGDIAIDDITLCTGSCD
ncbi:MAM and LDL-receptor class A domain-containing protein 1-like [Mytilus edulis]|uniref:MAM and LDL-receptor class A domain-containing protein 1-like n=1 Tax=Mytilus edulis TaxID=6550 RepID=UPI0039EFA0F3